MKLSHSRVFRVTLAHYLIALGIGFYSSYNWAASAAFIEPNPLQSELSGKTCKIYQDKQGIPHLRVSPLTTDSPTSIEQLGYACLGYIQGRDRSWEMDYFRRTVQGRKSEVYGKDSLQSDFFLRLLGLVEKADSLFQNLDSYHQNLLWAYSWGANQGFKAALKRGVYEFQKLGYEPDAWRPQDSIALILLQSFDQTKRSFQTQFDEKNWIKKMKLDEAPADSEASQSSQLANSRPVNTVEEARQLFSWDGLPWDTSILKKGEYSSPQVLEGHLAPGAAPEGEDSQSQGSTADLQSLFKEISSPWDGPGVGSNNWVLDAKRSETGHAWLANDPHLRLVRPAFWQWVHLDIGKIDVMGATLPGVPVFASASNRHLSWGLTNAYLPVARVSYVPEKDLEAGQSFRPWIWVKLWKFKLPFVFKSFQRTRTGLPVLPLPAPQGKAIVLRWTVFDLESKDIAGSMDLIRAQNVAEADQVFSETRVPSWNFVFADDQGHIGFRATGRAPRFKKEPPVGIPSESLDEVEKSSSFQDPLRAGEMPHVINPARGYVVTANNRQWPSDSQFSSGRAQVSGFRAFRIEELLKQTQRHSQSSIQKIQCDLQAVDARFILPELLKIMENTKEKILGGMDIQKPIQVLKDWNYETGLTCTACALFRRWVAHIYEDQSLDSSSLYRVLRQSLSPDFKKETGVPEVVKKSLQLALVDLHYDQTNTLPIWSSIHQSYFHHLSGDERFEVEPISTPGDDNSVNPGSAEWNGKMFDHNAGASQRLIVEMSQPPKIYSVLAGSNQDLENPNLADPQSPWQDWVHCGLKRQEFPLDWSQVEAQTEAVRL